MVGVAVFVVVVGGFRFRHGAVSFLKNKGNARPEGRAFLVGLGDANSAGHNTGEGVGAGGVSSGGSDGNSVRTGNHNTGHTRNAGTGQSSVGQGSAGHGECLGGGGSGGTAQSQREGDGLAGNSLGLINGDHGSSTGVVGSGSQTGNGVAGSSLSTVELVARVNDEKLQLAIIDRHAVQIVTAVGSGLSQLDRAALGTGVVLGVDIEDLGLILDSGQTAGVISALVARQSDELVALAVSGNSGELIVGILGQLGAGDGAIGVLNVSDQVALGQSMDTGNCVLGILNAELAVGGPDVHKRKR